MPTFALRNIEAIKGKQSIDKLLIDGNCQFDDFESLCRGHKKYEKAFAALYRYMEYVADGVSLPENHFRELKGATKYMKEYEFKANDLRLYAIKKPNGKIIVMGGFKTSQKEDIARFRRIKQLYIESIKAQGHEPGRASKK